MASLACLESCRLGHPAETRAQSALFTLPIYLSAAQYLSERQEMLRLTDEAMAQFVALFSGPMYAGMVVLTVATSLAGALVSLRVMRKHFEKAGIV